jgi:hypothetical protein
VHLRTALHLVYLLRLRCMVFESSSICVLKTIVVLSLSFDFQAIVPNLSIKISTLIFFFSLSSCYITSHNIRV